MNSRCGLAVCAGFFLALTGSVFAADTNTAATTAPKPAIAKATNAAPQILHAPAGFHTGLVAAAPQVINPVAMTFDENGRLFVLEQSGTGRIRLLEDTDGNGHFETNRIFASDLPAASALIWSSGGLFVATSNNVIFLRDTNNDGAADIRIIAINDLNAATGKTNGAVTIHDFVWGPDNRIHAVGAGFSFNPRTRATVPEPTDGERSLCFDLHGDPLLCVEGQPLQAVMFNERYTSRNPFLLSPPAIQNLTASDSSIRITGSCLIDRGLASPAKYNLLMADTMTHSIHRLALSESGLETTVDRGTDFLTSDDPEFTPAQIVPGPDGAIYIVDSQARRVRQGRIWRIVPDRQVPKPPRLGKAVTYDLVATLAFSDVWRRETAARLLVERRDPAAVPLLVSMLSYAKVPLARFSALQMLDTLGVLNEQRLLPALKDSDPLVRERGVLLAEKFVKNGAVSGTLWSALAPLAGDNSIHVRCQFAFTLGEIMGGGKPAALAEILRRDPGDRWIQTAAFSSLNQGAGGVFMELASNNQFQQSSDGAEFLRQLANLIGVQNNPDDVAATLQFIEETRLDSSQSFTLLRGLSDGLRRAGSSFNQADPQNRLMPLYREALRVAVLENAPESLRVQAIRLLEVARDNALSVPEYLLLLTPNQPPSVQLAVVHTLAHLDDQAIATMLLQRQSVATPGIRGETLAALLTRPNNAGALLLALESGRLVRPDEFSSSQINFLRTYNDPAIRQRALRFFGTENTARRDAVKQFAPALKMQGSVERGHALFTARCSACHDESSSHRSSFGPPLVFDQNVSHEKLLSDILTPSAEISPGYATYVLELRDGEKLVGLVNDLSAPNVLLRRTDGTDILLPQRGLQSTTRQNWSLMPEEAADRLTAQDLADLIEFITTLR